MQGLQRFVGRRLNTILLVMLAAGFAMVLAEMLLTDHVDGIQLVAPISSALGLVAVLVGLFAQRGLRTAMAGLLLVLSVAGVVGTFEHFEQRSEGGERGEAMVFPANQNVAYAASGLAAAPAQDDDAPRPGREGGESVPPPLAPLSIAGLGLMSAIVLFSRQDASAGE